MLVPLATLAVAGPLLWRGILMTLRKHSMKGGPLWELLRGSVTGLGVDCLYSVAGPFLQSVFSTSRVDAVERLMGMLVDYAQRRYAAG